MNAVCLQKTVHCTGDLALEITHDNHGGFVVSSGLTNTVDVGDDDLFYVVDHGGFVGPVLWKMYYIPLWWKLELGMAPHCFSLVDYLDRQEVAN